MIATLVFLGDLLPSDGQGICMDHFNLLAGQGCFGSDCWGLVIVLGTGDCSGDW